ncbi:hypothetical protein O181_081669 [Austropuccinia psidii MF-1]|uniref:Uncharacterized protein n=1 Tax=Austropuccinia psidii MF-1 TaxID=1389203 RepID=A0A9Q3FN92_9BASI|nr:hypothetical protein [Austropuccinia psidii MF-1]
MSAKSSSRKTHLKDSRTAPHSPRSVPTSFDVNSEAELIDGTILSAEPLPSGSHRNISVPIQKWVRRSNRRGAGTMPKPLEGGHELLLTHEELSGSGGDHRTLRRKKELEMTPAFKEGPVVSTSSKPAPEASKGKPKGPQKKKDPKNKQEKGKGKENWHRPYPRGYRIPK